jgi:hypothetical protein
MTAAGNQLGKHRTDGVIVRFVAWTSSRSTTNKMKNMKTVGVSFVPGVLAALALIVTTANAAVPTLVNGGFESGNLTGWTIATNLGSAKVVSSHLGDLGTLYAPVEGNWFAELKAGLQYSNQMVMESIPLNVGDMLTGYAAFDYVDAHPYNDFAFVRIFNSSGAQVAQPWVGQGANVPNNWDGPWTPWSWTAPVTGTYSLRMGVVNDIDKSNSSFGLFDAVQLVPIPEPGTGALMVGALLLLPFGKRLIRKA